MAERLTARRCTWRRPEGIDGMICVTSFGCGVDSFVYDLIERRVKNDFGIPFLIMTVDEHTGEAGFLHPAGSLHRHASLETIE